MLVLVKAGKGEGKARPLSGGPPTNLTLLAGARESRKIKSTCTYPARG